jgi:hypothetical protein
LSGSSFSVYDFYETVRGRYSYDPCFYLAATARDSLLVTALILYHRKLNFLLLQNDNLVFPTFPLPNLAPYSPPKQVFAPDLDLFDSLLSRDLVLSSSSSSSSSSTSSSLSSWITRTFSKEKTTSSLERIPPSHRRSLSNYPIPLTALSFRRRLPLHALLDFAQDLEFLLVCHILQYGWSPYEIDEGGLTFLHVVARGKGRGQSVFFPIPLALILTVSHVLVVSVFLFLALSNPLLSTLLTKYCSSQLINMTSFFQGESFAQTTVRYGTGADETVWKIVLSFPSPFVLLSVHLVCVETAFLFHDPVSFVLDFFVRFARS